MPGWESHAASSPWLQPPTPLSTGSAPPKFQRCHHPGPSAVWVGTWQCCTSPRHPRAQLFLGGSVSMARTLMRHAGLTICHLSIYLCVYRSSIYFCIYHLFIYLSSINSVSVCVSIVYLLTYLPPTNYTNFCIYHVSIYQLSVYLCIYHLLVMYLLPCLSSIYFCISLSTYVSIIYNYVCIYLPMYLSSICLCICVRVC